MAIDIYKPQKDGVDVAIKVNLPIGSIYENKFNINVEDYFYGTWSRWGNGEVLVGVNEGDNDFGTPDKALGAKTHTLTVAQMPGHQHNREVYIDNGNAMNGGVDRLLMYGRTPVGTVLTVGSSIVGSDQPHNNIQPSRTVYRWIRVA